MLIVASAIPLLTGSEEITSILDKIATEA